MTAPPVAEQARFIACWSAKGGQGTTTVATSLALQLTERAGPKTILVDLAGDVPAVLGRGAPSGPPDVSEWLRMALWDPPPRLPSHGVSDRLAVVPRGDDVLEPASATRLAQALAASGAHVVVDCGTITDPVASQVAHECSTAVLVTRQCPVALRHAVDNLEHPQPDGVVVLTERWRTVATGDIERMLRAPVVAEIPVTRRVAEAYDAGMLHAERPAALNRLGGLLRPDGPRPGLDDIAQNAVAVLDTIGRQPGPGAPGLGVG